MAINKKHKGKVTLANLDDCLMFTGYMLPENEHQLEKFNKLYEDYDFKLKNVNIDVEAIIQGTLPCKIKSVSLNNTENPEILNLRMVARKGEAEIPAHILEKMKKKHRPDKND